MSEKPPFRVVIVGASVAGLGLANMLQANGIDFLVLEAYPTIAPQVGASIGLLPHGNRILDQLGLYEKVMEVAPAIQVFNFRDSAGKVLAQHPHMDERLVERHGYPMVFLDRQMLLKILYDNIKDKSKILTGKRVVQAKLTNGGVQAVTADGTIIAGDILVGADGVHSAVRSEMWRLARSLSPGLFDPNESEAPPCENSCIFGISNPCPGINPGDLHCVFRDNSSYLVTGGPQGRVYWFRFQKLPKSLHGSAIPCYNEKDLQKALSESAGDQILPNLKFSTLVENKVSAVMTPLVEYVYKQWHYDRIITLGDSAHKFHPVGGQGGNAAIESVALLTNSLVKALQWSVSGNLTTVQVESIFADVQSRRKPRLALNHRYSHNRANTEALDTPLNRLMAIRLLPLVDEQIVTLGYCSQHPGGEMLDMLPVRQHENLIPYKQELLCEPRPRGYMQWIWIATYIILAIIAICVRENEPSPPQLDSISVRGHWDNSSHGKMSTLCDMTGSEFDSCGITPKPIHNHTFGHYIQPAAIIVIESYRGRNKLTPLRVPTIWLMMIQYVGLGATMPLYFLMYTLISDAEPYWNRSIVMVLAGSLSRHLIWIILQRSNYTEYNAENRSRATDLEKNIQPDGSVDETLCKIREVEKDLGRIQGVMETLWVAGDFVMTIPLSFLAEKWGRRVILRLNLFSRSFMLLWAIIVGCFDTLLPTRAIMIGPVLSVLGGDCVFNSLTYGLVSNLMEDHIQRAIYFGYMSSVSYVVALLGPALASSTMTLSLWLPFWLGIFLLGLAVPTIQVLPASGITSREPDFDDESQHEPLLSSPRLKAQKNHESLLQSVLGRLQTIKAIVVSHPKNFSLLLFSYMLTSLASSDTKLLVQYISARYKWAFASAGYLLSGKAIVNFTLLTIVIPKLLRSARQVRQEDVSEAADKSNIRNAMYCLVASVFGALGIALASEIWILVPSMFVYALGSALPIFTLSLLKSPVISPPHTSDTSDPEPHIFSIVMLVKTSGSLLGAPLMAALWVRGLEIGGMALGMPFFVSQACYVVAIWVFSNIEVDRDALAAAERRRYNQD
ncbi:zeaxanthin epoxidase chloroplastic [Fusarium beomiforme]|uniref:Zeaxanthin epoxidase chloroplastic n=1 Tax=Fusarium beomiforme TaxID=44412 RepID=A0A9P5AUA4_9HYPO|nr:zeaxanthin epoxidase chloroplastic [Fusarium beomiforme]